MFRPIWQIAMMLAEDLRLAGNLIKKAKSLYLILFCLWLGNFLMLLTNGNFALAKEKVIIRSLFYILATFLVLAVYEIWKYKKASRRSEKITRFWFFYRTLAWISWLINLMMIQLIVKYGFWTEMILVHPPYLLISIWIMVIYDKFYKSGHDLLYIDYLKALPDQKEKNFAEKISAWILKSRVRVFILGSTWFEPDIATLILRKKHKTNFKEVMRYTLPSAIICTTFWSVVFYLGVIGWNHFSWFIN